MPQITVAITTYNLENTLSYVFEELRQQTFQDFEILVYDDCSTDRTREIICEAKSTMGQKLDVLLGDCPQRLPSKARNVILNSGKIHGKYILFLDGDDRIEPDFLEQLYRTAEKSQADITVCAYDRFEDGTNHVLCREMMGYPGEISISDQENISLAFINTSLWNKLIRVEMIQNICMPVFSVGEDACFLFEIYMRCKKIAFVNDILIHYRVRPSSVISNTPEQTIYQFANELWRLWNEADNSWMQDNIAFAAFVHIGLSMALRANDNAQINIKTVLGWINNYFSERFKWFKGNRYFRFSFLLRQGIKGLGIFGALVCYRIHCFRLFLWAYKMVTTKLHIDIKF